MPTYTVSATALADMASCRVWFGRFFADAASLPIAFVFGGRSITDMAAVYRTPANRCRSH